MRVLATLLLLTSCLPDDFGVFHPERTDRYQLGGGVIPAALVDELALFAADGVPLAAVLARHDDPGSHPTVLYLHGQSGNIDDAWKNVGILWSAGFNVLALDYRGYGRSAGDPSEAGMYLDAAAAFAAVVGDARLDPSRVVVWGHSMGSAVASHVVLFAPATLVVLESPFTSMRDMIEASSPYAIPGEWWADAEFDTLGRIGGIPVPVVIVWGDEDLRVPHWMPEALYAAAVAPSRFIVVPGASHSNALERGVASILEAIAGLASEAAP